MAADRWYYLRHPDGFNDDRFDCVRSGWLTWKNHVESTIRHWQHVGVPNCPAPDYEWFEPELSPDRKTVTVPVGGEGTYGSYHTFEETIPDDLLRYLPMWFRIDLETGRKDTAGWFPEVSWGWAVDPKERDGYRKIFPPPKE
jgi:hypothetical protein